MFDFNNKPKEKKEKPKKTPEQLEHAANNRAKSLKWGIGSAITALVVGNSPMGEAVSKALSPDELLTPKGVSYAQPEPLGEKIENVKLAPTAEESVTPVSLKEPNGE